VTKATRLGTMILRCLIETISAKLYHMLDTKQLMLEFTLDICLHFSRSNSTTKPQNNHIHCWVVYHLCDLFICWTSLM